MSNISPTAPKLLTEREAASYLNVKPQTLTAWRCTKRYPLKFSRIGRAVRYRLDDLDAFICARTVSN